MKFEKYKHFTAEDFVLDPDFKENALSSSENEESFFRALAEQFPEKQGDILEARKVVLQLDRHYRRQLPTKEEKAAVYEEIMRRRHQPNAPPRKELRPVKQWLSVAASVLVLVAAFWLLKTGTSNPKYTTSFAEMENFQLPDGSEVALNANSTLEFSRNWKDGKEREVWLTGEAYFKVVKKAAGTKFTVHTNGPDIEVLGTQFNVNTRPGRTLIMLEEGQIQLKPKDSSSPSIRLEERQLADYSQEQEKIISNVDPEKYRLWIKGYFSVDNLSFDEVVGQIKSIYGVEVIVEKKQIRQISLAQGALPIRNLQELIESFETLYQVTISQKNGTLYIR